MVAANLELQAIDPSTLDDAALRAHVADVTAHVLATAPIHFDHMALRRGLQPAAGAHDDPRHRRRPRWCRCWPVRHRPPRDGRTHRPGRRPRCARPVSTTRSRSRTSGRLTRGEGGARHLPHPLRLAFHRRARGAGTDPGRAAAARAGHRPPRARPAARPHPDAGSRAGPRRSLPEARAGHLRRAAGRRPRRVPPPGRRCGPHLHLAHGAAAPSGARGRPPARGSGALRQAEDLFEAEPDEIDARLAGGTDAVGGRAGRADRPATGGARRCSRRSSSASRRPTRARPRPLPPTVARLAAARDLYWGAGGRPEPGRLRGRRHRSRAAQGRACVLTTPGDLGLLEPGDVLVAVATTTSLNAAFPLVAGVATAEGRRLQPRRDPLPRVRRPRRGRRRRAPRRGARRRPRRGRRRRRRGAADRPRRSRLTGVASRAWAPSSRTGGASTTSRSITTDMDATVRFYHGVLGARLVATIGTPGLPALLLRVRSRADRRLLRVPGRRARAVRQAGRHPRPAGDPVRPPLVQPPRRGGARVAAPPAEGARLRGHRRRRPRGDALDLLHRPERHRARGVVVGDRRDRPRTPTTATATSSPTPTRCPAFRELATTGQLAYVPATRLVGDDPPPDPA